MNKFFKIFLYLFCLIYLFCSFFCTALAVTCTEKYLNSTGKCASDCASLGADYVIDSSADLCTSPDVCCHEVANTTGTASSLELQVPLFDYNQAANLPEYIVTIYKYAVIVIIPLAVMMIIIGGVLWISAAGNPSSIKKAQKYIFDALIGLAIAFLSYTLFSLVGIQTLTQPNVEYISPMSGDLLWIEGQGTTTISGGGENQLPASRKGSAQAFADMPCPKGQSSFDVFFTFYYKPKYGDAGGHDHIPKYEDFWCNVGMQCSCPNKASGSCASHKNRCNPFGPDVPYCNSTGGNIQKPPIGGYTIAGEIRHCFKRGCKIMIEGKGPYEIHDAGAPNVIKGLHMDYFVDFQANRGIPPPGGVYKVTVIDPASCFQ